MTHHPKNIYCTTCCIAKAQRAPHRRKHHKYWEGKPRPAAFGDQIAADHIIAYSERSKGVTGHQAAVVYGDRATGWFDGFPIGGKTTCDTHDALIRFLGSEKALRVWTDNSPELIATMRTAKVSHDLCTQGQPQTNGRAERLVLRTMDGTKTLTLQAGLPGAFGRTPCAPIATHRTLKSLRGIELGTNAMIKDSGVDHPCPLGVMLISSPKWK